VLTETPNLVETNAESPPAVSSGSGRSTPEGRYLTIGSGHNAMPVVLADDANGDEPLSLVIPLDGNLPDRLATALRFWQSLTAHPPEDPRLTLQRRKRIRNILQASDGRTGGASYQNIARAMFGEARLASESWKTSSIRDVTIRLVRDGKALIDGGYRSLLQYQHRS
jgi:hypothetical protein